MAVFELEHNEDYSSLLQKLEKCVNDNTQRAKGKEKEVERTLDQVEYAFQGLLENQLFKDNDYFKLKLQH